MSFGGEPSLPNASLFILFFSLGVAICAAGRGNETMGEFWWSNQEKEIMTRQRRRRRRHEKAPRREEEGKGEKEGWCAGDAKEEEEQEEQEGEGGLLRQAREMRGWHRRRLDKEWTRSGQGVDRRLGAGGAQTDAGLGTERSRAQHDWPGGRGVRGRGACHIKGRADSGPP